MSINSPWFKHAEDSALLQASNARALKNAQDLIAENLKGLVGFELNPELLEQAVNKTIESIQNEKPEIKILGSHQEGDVLIVDVEVPLHMAHLFKS